MEKCVKDTGTSMFENKMKRYNHKTKFLIIGFQNKSNLEDISLVIYIEILLLTWKAKHIMVPKYLSGS